MRHRSPIQRKKPGTPEPSAPTRLDLASPPVEFAVPSGVPEVLTASGHPLDSTTQEQLSAQFGHDFSQVRVHTDERAAASAQALDARAYTVGQDLVFGASEYAPTTQSGQWLIAHELAHVTQQAAMPTPTTPLAKRLTISQPGDLLEQEADAAADQVMLGMRLTRPSLDDEQDNHSSDQATQRFSGPSHDTFMPSPRVDHQPTAATTSDNAPPTAEQVPADDMTPDEPTALQSGTGSAATLTIQRKAATTGSPDDEEEIHRLLQPFIDQAHGRTREEVEKTGSIGNPVDLAMPPQVPATTQNSTGVVVQQPAIGGEPGKPVDSEAAPGSAEAPQPDLPSGSSDSRNEPRAGDPAEQPGAPVGLAIPPDNAESLPDEPQASAASNQQTEKTAGETWREESQDQSIEIDRTQPPVRQRRIDEDPEDRATALDAIRAVTPDLQAIQDSNAEIRAEASKGSDPATLAAAGRGPRAAKAADTQALQESVAANNATLDADTSGATANAQAACDEARTMAETANATLESRTAEADRLASTEVRFAQITPEMLAQLLTTDAGAEETRFGSTEQHGNSPVIMRKVAEPEQSIDGELDEAVKADVLAQLEEQRAIASSMVTGFVGEVAGRVQSITALGQTIPLRIQPAAASASAAILAAVEAQAGTLTAQIEQMRVQAASRAQATREQITQQYETTATAIKEATATSRAQIETEYATTLTTIDERETEQLTEVTSLYSTVGEEFRLIGNIVGTEALTRGAQKAADYRKGRINRDDSLMDGPLTDNRCEARANAATEVSSQYQQSFIQESDAQANEIQTYKPDDIEKIHEIAKQSRESVTAQYTAALENLTAAEQQSLTQAEASRISLLESVDQALESTLQTLAQQETAQIQTIRDAGQHQALAITQTAHVAIASLQEHVGQSATNLMGMIQSLPDALQDTPAPDPGVLAGVLADVRGQIDASIAGTQEQLEAGITSAEQRVTQTSHHAVASQATSVQAVMEQITDIGSGFATALAELVQGATDTFSQLRDAHQTTVTEVATTTTEGFKQESEGIAATFNALNQSLTDNFARHISQFREALFAVLPEMDAKIAEEAEKAAEQVQPRWKGLLKIVLIIVVIVVVAVVVGPLLVGLGPVAAVLAGAAVGAASGAVIQMGNNLIDGKHLLDGVAEAAIAGAIGGAFGGLGGVLFKGVANVGLRLVLETGMDTVGEIASSLVLGQPITLESLAFGAVFGLGMAGNMELGGAALKNISAGRTMNAAPPPRGVGSAGDIDASMVPTSSFDSPPSTSGASTSAGDGGTMTTGPASRMDAITADPAEVPAGTRPVGSADPAASEGVGPSGKTLDGPTSQADGPSSTTAPTAAAGKSGSPNANATPAHLNGQAQAKANGWPDAPDGYEWYTGPDGTPQVRNKPGNDGPVREYDPETRTFREKPDTTPKPDVRPIEVEKRQVRHDDLDDPDRARLKELEAERTAAQERKHNAEAAGNTEAARQAHGEMCRASEQLGEAATDIAVKQMMPDAQKLQATLPGDQKFGEFDRIYKDGENVYIIESKGAGAQRGSRETAAGIRAEQGTPQYRDDIIRDMQKKISEHKLSNAYGNNPDFRAHIDELASTVKALEQASNAGKLHYGQVNQKVDANGNLKPEIEITWFDPNTWEVVSPD